MNSELIPLDHTGQFPRLITDYISKKEDIQDFSEYSPNMEGLLKRIEYLNSSTKNTEFLASVLEEQHANQLSDSQKSNLDTLKSNNALTVCTGHQLCLFGGPVYMIYKIASVISLSNRLASVTGLNVVPIFWMASEDHDVEEVSSISLFGRRISFASQHQGPVGKMSLKGIDIVLKELDDILGESQGADSASQMIKAAYSDAPDMATAFRSLIQGLFGKYGLLILDAADKRLKASFFDSVVTEVKEQLTYSSIQDTLTMLESRGESPQASPREVNLFYMLDDSRKRIINNDQSIEVLDGPIWTFEEFKKELADFPERFSPNVLFRPVYQEHLLPNIAYIGGPGELSYWLELKESFRAFGLKMPVLILRDSFVWLDSRTEKRWNDLGFKAIDLFRDEDSLHKEFAKKNSEEEPDLSDDKETMLRHFDGLIEKSHSIDPGILGFAKSERARLLKSIDNLEKKLIRAEKKKHSDSLKRISTIRSKFLPGGNLRERNENFLHWYLRYGEEFLDMLLEMSDPLEPKVKVVKI